MNLSLESVRCHKLGELVVSSAPGKSDRILLYGELDDGDVAPSLFYTRDWELFYSEPNDALFDELFLLQEQWGPEVRAIEFEVCGEQFQTRFIYADSFDEASDKPARTAEVLQARFGRTDARY